MDETTDLDKALSNLESAANVHEAIVAVRVACPYVQKQRTQGLNYAYLGIDATLEELLPSLNAARLSIVPLAEGTRLVKADTFKTSKGTVMQRLLIKGVYRITHRPSDTYVDICGLGEGSDVGDKATAKAKTAALKDALRQAFLLKSGDIDPDTKASQELGATSEKMTRAEQALMACRDNDRLQRVWTRILEKPFSPHQLESLQRVYNTAKHVVETATSGGPPRTAAQRPAVANGKK